MSVLEVKNIKKSFGKTEVLKGIGFSLEKGEVLAIIGSSGSGKTTLLRCLNFLETPSTGKITVNDNVLFDSDNPSKNTDSEIRKSRLHFGLVFQSFNLFNNMTVLENCMVGQIKVLKKDKETREKYEQLKVSLASRHAFDRRAYSLGKGEFVPCADKGQGYAKQISVALFLTKC